MIESSVIDSLLPYILPLDSPILAGASVSGGTFIATTIFHPVGENFFQVQLSEIPTTIDAAGWSALINATPTTVTFISISGSIATFGIGATQVDDSIYVSYDGAGNTIFEGTQLKAFTDVKASNPLTGETRWLAGGSPFMLTDGDITTGDAHVMHGQFIGEGSPAFVTPADMHLPDFEGVYREVEQNTAPWYGARKVQYLGCASEALDASPWAVSEATLESGFPAPDGTNTAYRITATGTSAYPDPRLNRTVSMASLSNYMGQTVRCSWWVRQISASTAPARRVDIAGGEGYTDITGELTDQWQRFAADVSVTIDSVIVMSIGINDGAEGDILEVWHPQVEFVTGKSNDAPSEYIATTSEHVTRYYDNENGNTVLDNVVTEAEGAQIDPAPSLYAAPAAENIVPWSRDLTNASWVNSINMVATYDQVGITGEPNTATLMSNNAVGGSTYARPLLSGSPIANQPMTQVAYVKKGGVSWCAFSWAGYNVGGVNYFDLENGVLGTTADSSAIVDIGNGWFACMSEITLTDDVVGHLRLYLATADLTPTVPVGLSSNMIVSNYEVHVGKTIDQVKGLYPIFTEGAAVSNAAIALPYDIANHSNEQGAYYCELTAFSEYAARIGVVGGGSTGRLIQTTSSTHFQSYSGEVQMVAPYSQDAEVPYRMAIAYDSSTGNAVCNGEGVYGTESTSFVAYEMGKLSLLMNESFFSPTPVPSLIRNVRRYDLPYAEAKAKIDELMAL